MKKSIIYALLLVLTNVAVSCIYVSHTVTTKNHVALDTKFASIRALGVNGDLFDVKILPSSDDSIRIYSYVGEIVSSGRGIDAIRPVKTYIQDGVLTVDVLKSTSVIRCRGFVKIYIPKGLESISVMTKTRDISARGITVGILDLRSKHGDVTIDKCTVEKQSVRGHKTEIKY